ncbi:nuclear transport factor 2 family protein [Pseudoglutamicibacter albus]|uniref:nuclear transport factor 2 family protein n=1 Tax=Pseudoglutamicibacter albus TaxID=98671 RepID=UPI001EF43937|nr:nuclear transport factor 2 family protein [Pseudoglutamicibacter albus]MCG7304460.1 nuclear transport factor 2 family protein [Pseudoglutamicibacter albus]
MNIEERIAQLEEKVFELTAEQQIRKIQARYMMLCDTPCPDPEVSNDSERIEKIMELYTKDATWEGVGEYYEGQFGLAQGHDEIRAHFGRFWAPENSPALCLNAHYLTTERIAVKGNTAEAHWIHMQPWLYEDGTALLRSSRLFNAFRLEGDEWKITRTRTENVFVAPLPAHFASNYANYSVLMSEDPSSKG